MNERLSCLIQEKYGDAPDYPWGEGADYAVFRHPISGKWYALWMNIPAEKLGLQGGRLDVVNLKCPKDRIMDLRMEKGVYPAYHMNRDNWVSVVLAELTDAQLQAVLDISHAATATKGDRTKYFKVGWLEEGLKKRMAIL